MSLICSANALRALHRVLVCTRFEAYESCNSKTLGDVTDSTEYLVALLQNHEDRSEQECLYEFRSVLADIESRFAGYEGLTAVFDAEGQAASAEQLATANR